MSRPAFDPVQARVVAALYEKAMTTPQYYPMTLNAVTAACNQKSCRRPVMRLGEGEVGAALNALETAGFCRRDDSGARAVKWRQQFRHQMLLDEPACAVLVTLMLRGPQTASELRANARGLKGPADAETMNAVLERLCDGPEPLAVLLPRAPGQKEARYAHCLCGEPESVPAGDPPRDATGTAPGTGSLAQRVGVLEARVAELEARVAELSITGQGNKP